MGGMVRFGRDSVGNGRSQRARGQRNGNASAAGAGHNYSVKGCGHLHLSSAEGFWGWRGRTGLSTRRLDGLPESERCPLCNPDVASRITTDPYLLFSPSRHGLLLLVVLRLKPFSHAAFSDTQTP